MSTILATANEFLAILGPCSHLKLQKLCYFSNCYSIALLDKRLFYEDMEMWRFGIVCPKLYEECVKIGQTENRRIMLNTFFCLRGTHGGLYVPKIEDRGFLKLIQRVAQLYGELTDTQLSNLSHRECDVFQKMLKLGYKGNDRSGPIVPYGLIKSTYEEICQNPNNA